MSWTPTEVKAARAIADAWGWTVLTSWHRLTGDEQEKCLSAARAVLVAVGPHIAAQALRDAAVALSATGPTAPNMLRGRAFQIEKEAGR